MTHGSRQPRAQGDLTWPLVATLYNLEVLSGHRPGRTITAQAARKIALRAIGKLRRELARQGVTEATFLAYLRLRDNTVVRNHDNLAAIMAAPARVRDDADPVRYRSLLHAR